MYMYIVYGHVLWTLFSISIIYCICMYYQWCISSDIILTYKKDDDEDKEGEAIGTNKKSSNAAKRKAFFNKMIEKGLEIERQKPEVAGRFLLGAVCIFLMIVFCSFMMVRLGLSKSMQHSQHLRKEPKSSSFECQYMYVVIIIYDK